MPRGTKQIPGQMTIEMCIDRENYIVQANSLIGGRQALGLNAAKLIRAAIMQIKPEEETLQPYFITVKQLAELLEISPDNFYRVVKQDGNKKVHYIDEITDEILENPVFIKDSLASRERWVKGPATGAAKSVSRLVPDQPISLVRRCISRDRGDCREPGFGSALQLVSGGIQSQRIRQQRIEREGLRRNPAARCSGSQCGVRQAIRPLRYPH